MNPNIIQKLIKNIRLELDDEFDQNFERKAFFTDKWKETRTPRTTGSLLARTGALRKSIQSETTEDSIIWSSSLPYASIHNSGGRIRITAKMKKYFWAMFYKSGGKDAEKEGNTLTQEQQSWKYLALKTVGSELLIPKRQFIGNHPQVNNSIQEIFEESKEDLEEYLNQQFGI